MKKKMSAGQHRATGSGGRRLAGATAALGLVLTGLGGIGLVSTAAAAPGDSCEINAVVSQDVTWSFSDQDLADTKTQLGELAQSFVDGDLPATLGVTSFGQVAPLATAVPFLGADVLTAAGADDFTQAVNDFDFDFDPASPGTSGSGGTNWQDGLAKARTAAAEQGANTILFVTDGVPNTWITETGEQGGFSADYNPEAAAEAAKVMTQLRADGYTVVPVFVATGRPGLHGLNDPDSPTPVAIVEEAMQVLQAGWTIDQAVEIDELGAVLRANALATCSPSIDLVKSHQTPVDVNGNGLVDAGDTVTYVFDVTNTGDLDLTNVTVTDATLAARGVSLVGGVIGDLAIGGTAQVLSNPLTLTDADVIAGSFDNSATVEGDSPAGPVTDEDDDTVPTEYRNGITIEKSHADTDVTDVNGNGLTDAGDTVVFTFDVTNTGTTTLTDVTITDQLLAERGVTLENGGLLGTLTAGASGSLQSLPMTITQADVDNGVFVNTATVIGTPPVGEPPTDEDDDNVPTGPHNGITIEKSHADTDVTDVNGNGLVDSGDTVVYTFDVTNTGTTTLTDVTVTDDTLAERGVTLENGGLLGTLTPGASGSLRSLPMTITQADVDNGEFINTATVIGTPPVGEPPTDEDDDKIVPSTKNDIELVKSHKAADITDVNGNGLTDQNDTVVFTFDVTNTGTTTLTAVTVTDPVLAERGVTLENGGLLGTLAPGETKSIRSNPAAITAADVAAGGFRNVATATGTPPRGDKPVDEDDDLVTTQRPVPPVVAGGSGSGGGMAIAPASGSGSGRGLAATGAGSWLLPVSLSGLLLLLGGGAAVIASSRRESESNTGLTS